MRYYKRGYSGLDLTYYEIVAETHGIIYIRQRGLISNKVFKETFPISREKFKLSFMDETRYREMQF